jgi:hypothetical protein
VSNNILVYRISPLQGPKIVVFRCCALVLMWLGVVQYTEELAKEVTLYRKEKNLMLDHTHSITKKVSLR